MVQQRPINDDDKDVKPKIIEGTYLKFPAEFNVVSSNNITTINASAITSKHNYSLPPQAAYHHQPITLIGQSPQNQNKVIINPTHSGQTNLSIGSQMQDLQNKITTSNIKLNIVPSLAQVMQSGGLVIDAKGLTTSGDHKTTLLTTTSASGSVTPTAQLSYYQPQQQQQQQQQSQSLQMQQQPKVKLEKTVNMMYDSERNRVFYTNLPNKRGGAQFLTHLNPKMVNILPIQHKNNVSGTVQGIVTPTGLLNKNIQRVVTSPSQQQNQQQLPTLRQSGTGTTIFTTSGNIIGNTLNTSSSGNTSVSSSTLIIGTPTSMTGGISAASSNDIITTINSSNNTNTMNTNINNSGVLIATTSDTLANKLNNSDGTSSTTTTATTVSGININTTNR